MMVEVPCCLDERKFKSGGERLQRSQPTIRKDRNAATGVFQQRLAGASA